MRRVSRQSVWRSVLCSAIAVSANRVCCARVSSASVCLCVCVRARVCSVRGSRERVCVCAWARGAYKIADTTGQCAPVRVNHIRKSRVLFRFRSCFCLCFVFFFLLFKSFSFFSPISSIIFFFITIVVSNSLPTFLTLYYNISSELSHHPISFYSWKSKTSNTHNIHHDKSIL